MNLLHISLLQAAGQQGGGLLSMGMLALIVIIFYFFMIRPQNKRQKQIKAYQDNLKVGDEVVTTAGIHGTVKRVNETENTVVVNVATGTDICFDKAAIMPNQK